MNLDHEHEPCLGREPSRLEAEAFVQALVRWVGPGFHPDTDFNDYVTAEAGLRLFPPAQADRLNAKLDTAVAALAVGGDDVYDVAAPVQHALLASRFAQS